MPAKSQILSGNPQFYCPPLVQDEIFSWPIHAAKHLSRRIVIARHYAMTAMHDPAAAPAAIDTFLQYLDYWSTEHLDKFNPIVCSLALLSVARLATRPEVPESHQRKAASSAAVILKHFMSQVPTADNHSTANVFWACARLQLRPDDVHQGFDDKLAQRFIRTACQSRPQGISNVLWACSTMRMNPLNGGLLASLVAQLETWLSDEASDVVNNMQCLSVVMVAFATLRFYTPSVAELVVRRFHEGLLKGSDQPQGLSNLIWACASLGFCPPPHMLHQFMQSYTKSQQPYLIQHDTTLLYSLAVLGALTMDWFKATVQRLPNTRLSPPTLQQLYIALQALRPQDSDSPKYKDWLQVWLCFCACQTRASVLSDAVYECLQALSPAVLFMPCMVVKHAWNACNYYHYYYGCQACCSNRSYCNALDRQDLLCMELIPMS